MNTNTSNVELSIIVICFNMQREAARTLLTLGESYQRNVSSSEYQVIVIDNNSSAPLTAEFVESFGDNFEYHHFRTNSPSPAAAVNYGAGLAKGEFVACIVDGARMLTPGVVHYSLLACRMFKQPFISTLAWHLGPKEQNHSMLDGYCQAVEDRLLESIDWADDGYSLFGISTLSSSSAAGFLGGLPEECSYFVVKKSAFLEAGGFDERFISPGGGLVNHDFLHRMVERGNSDFVTLLGEGLFHQFHGGIASNAKPEEHPWKQFAEEYEKIRGKSFSKLAQPPVTRQHYLGSIRNAAAMAYVHTGEK